MDRTAHKSLPKHMHNKYKCVSDSCSISVNVKPNQYDLLDLLFRTIDCYIESSKKNNTNIASVYIDLIEDFCGKLRIYYEGGDEYICGLIDMAQEIPIRLLRDRFKKKNDSKIS